MSKSLRGRWKSVDSWLLRILHPRCLFGWHRITSDSIPMGFPGIEEGTIEMLCEDCPCRVLVPVDDALIATKARIHVNFMYYHKRSMRF